MELFGQTTAEKWGSIAEYLQYDRLKRVVIF